MHEHSPALAGGLRRRGEQPESLCKDKGRFATPNTSERLLSASARAQITCVLHTPGTGCSPPSADLKPPPPAAEPHAPGVAEGTGLSFLSLPSINWHSSPVAAKSKAAQPRGRWPLAASPGSPTSPFRCLEGKVRVVLPPAVVGTH